MSWTLANPNWSSLFDVYKEILTLFYVIYPLAFLIALNLKLRHSVQSISFIIAFHLFWVFMWHKLSHALHGLCGISYLMHYMGFYSKLLLIWCFLSWDLTYSLLMHLFKVLFTWSNLSSASLKYHQASMSTI